MSVRNARDGRSLIRRLTRPGKLAPSPIRVFVLAAHVGIVALAIAATATGAVDVAIRPLGLDPVIALVQNGSADWTNTTDVTQSVVSADGLFDSGPIPPGGGYSLHLPVPGDHAYTAWPGGFVGTLKVFRAALGGDPRDFAVDHIPDLAFPPVEGDDLALDPATGLVASKTRIMLGFKESATVAEANAALASAGVDIIGGLADVHMLLVRAAPCGEPSCGDFDGLHETLARLRGDPAVEFAAMSFKEEPQSLPRPASSTVNSGPACTAVGCDLAWHVVTAGDEPFGDGGDWWLESSRFPQAWNLLDPIRRARADVTTADVEIGFKQHDDLPPAKFSVLPLCKLVVICTANGGSDHELTHGTSAAGMEGAAVYDNPSATEPGRSRGVSGGNPVGHVVGVPIQWGGVFATSDTDMQVMDLLFDQADALHLRVVNHELAQQWSYVPSDPGNPQSPQWNEWWATHTEKNCGTNGNEWCTPENDPAWLTEMKSEGDAAELLAKRAAALPTPVVIVQAAGNSSGVICSVREAPCTHGFLDLKATCCSDFAVASERLGQTPDNPIVVVEALGQDHDIPGLGRAPFSDYGGDISAPGVHGAAPGQEGVANGYHFFNGTSMAAAVTTGAIGYLLAYDPALTPAEVRDLLRDWARPTNSAPRIDVFASLMSLPGAVRKLVDVNDRSLDGDHNEPIQPDDRIDMRDFRAFRDAWLVSCAYQDGVLDLSCPAEADVALSKSPPHREDLNLDGCVRNPDLTVADPACPTSEAVYSRFDFNGDGRVDNTVSQYMPVDRDGAPVGPPGTKLTDLQVLQSQWPDDYSETEGWTKSELDRLMESGDLEIHADDLFNAGASDVKVDMTSSDGTALPDRHIKPDLKPDRSFIVATVPTHPANQTKITISASATIAGETIKTTPVQVELKIGEDKRVDLCKGLTVTATPSELTDDGKETSKIVAQLHKCSSEEVANKPIAFSLDHTSGGVSLGAADATTDANGAAKALFTTGTATDTYKVKATVTLDAGLTETAEATIKVRPPIKIAYVWKQHIENWSEAGSTHWPASSPAMPDCTVPGTIDYCVDSFQANLTSETNGGIERAGTLDGGGSDFKLTEQVTNSLGRSHRQWQLTRTNGQVETFGGDATWQVSDPNAYQDKALTSVKATFQDDGIHVAGMQSVGDLPYHYDMSEQHPPGTQLDPPELLAIANRAFLLIPHVSEGPIRFAGRSDAEIAFPFDASTQTYQPYQSCAVLDVAGNSAPGYFVQRTDPYVPGFLYGRTDTYQPGAHPMPVGPSALKVTYSFGAVVTVGDGPAATPTLPDCSTNQAPVPKFDAPAETLEGRQTHFLDTSTDAENDIASWHWDFGDGEETSSQQNPYHRFPDNGTYTVTLTVTDGDGASASTSKTIDVKNQPPLAYIDDATVEEGQPLTFNYGIWDAGTIDRDQILWSLESSNPDWVTRSNIEPAFDQSATVENLPVGVYPMTLTVVDKDGESSTAQATFEVTQGPVPVCDPTTGENCPPVPPTPPYVVCDGSATLDAEEQSFLTLINLYRIENGVPPLGVSPTLQTAAGVHALDMAVNDFMSHVGSDGSQPWDRAWKAGYPTTAGVGENILSQSETGFQAMWAWKSSPPHNANMLNPDWKAIGIARAHGNQWRWSTSFGTVLDCPDAPSAGPVASSAKPSSASRQLASASNATSETPTGSEGLGPGAAFTISNVSPMAGKSVRLTNRSRDAGGQPVAATVDFDDGSGTVSLAPDASTLHSFPRPWEQHDVALTAVDAAGRSMTVDRAIFVQPLPQPQLAYTGPTLLAAAAKHFVATAVLRDPGGDPMAGVTLTFTFGDSTAIAATDASGAAAANLDLNGAGVGDQVLTVSFAGNADFAPIDDVRSIFIRKTTPDVTYTGALDGAVGKTLAVAARLLDPTTNEPVAGAPVTFTLMAGGFPAASATTDASGVATATLDLTGISPGTYTVGATFAGDSVYEIAQKFTQVTLTQNAAPVANAGGPYVLGVGGTLLLDGGLSTDPDPGDRVASWAWDLNGDGATDVTGVTPRELTWSELQTVLCTVACSANVDYPIKLTVTDSRGETGTATTTVRFASDFALLLGAGTTTIVPGQANRFAVTVVASSDFHSPVTLSAVGLPSGVSASFSVNPVTPPGISVLTLTATPSASTGTFPIRVSGTAVGISHEVSNDLKVAFGLVPVCYGTAEGTVVDDTGAPIAGASVSNFLSVTDTTDANGRFTLRNLPLGLNNAPSSTGVLATKDGYWSATGSTPVYCGATTHVALTMLAAKTGRVSGVVHEGTADPTGQIVTPTATTVPGASVDFATGPTARADADGAYAADLDLSQNNAARGYTATARAPGYWEQTKNVLAEASAPKQLDFSLVKQCHGTLVGGTLQYEDGSPAADHTVGIDELGLGFTAATTRTDADGNFSFERDELLGHNNAPRDYTLIAYGNASDPPGMQTQRFAWPLAGCGDRSSRTFTLQLPAASRGAIDGIVRDEETGSPIAGAIVSGYADLSLPGNTMPFAVTTDSDGHYHVDNVLIGYGANSAFRLVAATKDGYYTTQTPTTLVAGATTSVDVTLLRKRTGGANGHVRDAVTGAPIAGASVEGSVVCASVCPATDADGRYSATGIALGQRNAPVSATVTVSADDYWPQSKLVKVNADTTTTTDYDLLRKCTPAKIVGLVVDASTQQPIEHAQVAAGFHVVFTDASGRFELADVEPSPGNLPLQVKLTASAPGFISQSKTVTIFCGATIVVDFGTPQTALGVIVGKITDADSGTPLQNVFVGSEFGGAATTDANGDYRITGVPLGDQDTDRAWTVTAAPAGYTPITQTVVAKANTEVHADFSFRKLANHPPVAPDETVATTAGVPAPVLLQASDPDGDTLSYTIVTGPAHGVLSGVAPTLTYTPDPGYAGTDSFTFKASDGRLDSNVATVSLTIAGTNRAPQAADDELSTHANVALTFDPTRNDADPDGDTIQLVASSLSAPVHGRVTIDGDRVTYTPETGFVGDDTFDYRVTDGTLISAPAAVTIHVKNTPPVAQSASLILDEDGQAAIPFTASDDDGDPTTHTIVSGPDHGTIAHGVYTPASDYFGVDSIVFTANDGIADSPPATIAITVRPVNDPPRPGDDDFVTAEDTPATFDVLANDTAGPANESDQKLTLDALTAPGHGTATIDGNKVVYKPDPNFNGTDAFGYRVCDDAEPDARCADATVTVHVTPVNDPPSVTLAPATVDEGSAIPLVASASDVDGDSLTYTWQSDSGTIAAASGAQAIFTADDGPATAHVTVTVSDGSLETTATVDVTVNNVGPTVDASAQSPQYWGVPVRFVGSATDPSRADTAAGLNPSWSFGDGTAALPGASVEHTYPQPGMYATTFTATDKDGASDSASTLVEVKKRESSLTYTGEQTIDANGTVVLSARFADQVDGPTADLAGHTVVFALSGKTFTATTDAAGVAVVLEHPAVAPGTLTMSFDGDARYLPADTSARIDYPLVFGNGSGFFTIGPSTAAVGRTATFWSNSWAPLNHLLAPSSFKGYVSTAITPTCGARWTSRPGNSGDPPPTVPHYLAVVVTRAATQSGSVISSDVTHIAILKTASRFGPSPGHDGTGSVVEIVC